MAEHNLEMGTFVRFSDTDFRLLVTAMWTHYSIDSVQGEVGASLPYYFRYANSEVTRVVVQSSIHDTAVPKTISDLTEIIQLLKSKVATPKMDLAYDETSRLPPDQALLDLVVRLMFATACVTPGTIGGPIFKPAWKASETITQYIDRVYPLSSDIPHDIRPIRMDKLRMSYLEAYANVHIQWTDHLSDHLVLLKGIAQKTLYIYAHPWFLRASLRNLGAIDFSLACSTADSTMVGCLPPRLIRETLRTFDVLFPAAGDPHSLSILIREVDGHSLDPYLLRSIQGDLEEHEHPRDALEPEDARALYQKYPYWADRLYDLWREADDPMPVTNLERWSESRRNPRFTYWCAVVSIGVAIVFGLVANILGAMQLWISYCDWKNNSSLPVCDSGQ
ncbi:uncharacterized protein F4822DRAFT_9613 [Hypoxylon trugodes]|uniref:uncharacterized protein n=1 Tax=Hypoxylon trugodes TaxID=326681 RepID=UPI00219E292C|nr:uncharacterized protein F4822DRAFT_9613 [Hypoxylon trugodes]KAI1393365.1 hypothetical protein F4822DRAFT_9613 [Hypoxylon trugodes]